MAQRRYAPTATMGITRMPARRTATTALIGFTAACLLELDPGSAGFVEDTGAVAASMDAAASAGLADAGLQAAEAPSPGEAALLAAVL
jgi:hypothetical protein